LAAQSLFRKPPVILARAASMLAIMLQPPDQRARAARSLPVIRQAIPERLCFRVAASAVIKSDDDSEPTAALRPGRSGDTASNAHIVSGVNDSGAAFP
jgi:hypothetical protein